MNIIDSNVARPLGRKAIGGGLIVVMVAIIGGCAGTPDCLKSQRYEDASAFPKLNNPAGLEIPKPDSDMQIPNVSDGPVAAYSAAPQGTDSDNPQSRCLTTPPPLDESG